MPEIIVKAESERDDRGPVLLRERVTADNMEMEHYASQLIDRLRWAVSDASDAPDGAEVDEPEAA